VRQRLLLLVIAALLPLVVVIGALSFLSVSERQASLRDAAVGYSSDVMRSVDLELQAQRKLVDLLAKSPELDNAEFNLAPIYEVARRFVSQVEGWDRVILAEAGRGQILNTAMPLGSQLPGIVDGEGFNRALASNGTTVTNLTGPPPVAADQPAAVALRRRLDLPGRAVVMTVLVKPEIFAQAIGQARIEASWRPFLIDGADRVIFAPRAESAMGQRAGPAAIAARASGNHGVYSGQAWNGDPVVTAFVKSPETGWSAHVSIPATEFNEPLNRSQATIGGLTMLALLLFGVFAFVARRELVAMRTEAEALSRASRMEALGRMTGGVAHDFNNLLMVVATAGDMLRKRVSDKGAERFLNAIQSATDRGSRLTRQLTMFARGQSGEVATIELGLRLASIKSLLQQTVNESIPIAFQLPQEPLFVKVDPVQFDLAVVNIAANARDAMPNGGRIEIALTRSPYPDHTGRAGVRLAIRDTGTGIAKSDLPHVFEPFYTTKEIGKGSGLGLSHVYGFAQAHGGLADVESALGEGAVVSIYLPLSDAPIVSPGEEEEPVDISWRGDGLEAIVVDDNDDVRVLTGEVLADVGFRVRYASNASEALALCEAGADLLVTDIVMPGAMNGVALGRTVRQRWPDMQTILMTGYSDASAEAVSAGFRVISKPFTRQRRLPSSRRWRGAEA
jgi:signal transduction histidine kinase/CheY-like chemotaxis protein